MEDIAIGTVYDMVKIEKKASQPMNETELQHQFTNIGAWFSSDMHVKYYMLLNNERHDYTVFNFITQNYAKAVDELKEVLESRGNVHSIDYNHQENYYEIWVESYGEVDVYLFFPCDDFIIEV